MRALVTRLKEDRTREKVLVHDWPDPGSPSAGQVRTRTRYSALTNGTERNDLVGGNYAHADDMLPKGWGYQNVGEVIELGPRVRSLSVGDLLYLSQDHVEFCLEPEDGLHVKLPDTLDPREAGLFGMASVAMRSCRNADYIRDGEFRVVLDVAGVPGMEEKLIAAAQVRGTVLFVAGRFQVAYPFNLGQRREITLKQNSHFDRSDLDNLCRLVQRGLVRLAPMIRDTVPVAEAEWVYDTLRDEPAKLFGTVFDWSST